MNEFLKNSIEKSEDAWVVMDFVNTTGSRMAWAQIAMTGHGPNHMHHNKSKLDVGKI